MTSADYADDLVLLTNTSAESPLHSLNQPAGDIDLHMNSDKIDYSYKIKAIKLSF